MIKYFVIVLASVFIFTLTPIVKAKNIVVMPTQEIPCISETVDKDIVAYRRPRRRPHRRPHRRYRKNRRHRRVYRTRRVHRRHRGCFIDTMSSENFNVKSFLSLFLDNK